jgi:FMN phosphatase YigB (HAD superfamily)
MSCHAWPICEPSRLEGDAIAAARAGLTGIWLDRGVHPVTGEATSQADLSDPEISRIENLTDLICLEGMPGGRVGL